MTITIPTWLLWLVGIPLGIVLLIALCVGLYMIYAFIRYDFKIFP